MIYQFQNGEIRNEFNPVYNYYIYEIDLDIDLEKLKNFILKIEPKIKEKYPHSADGYTGLGDSLTSRFQYYNLLQMQETSFLKEVFRRQHDNFLNDLGYKIEENYYSQCWANVMRKGEKIKSHVHGLDNYCYLGGHLCVYSNNTNTYYKSPYYKNVFSTKNKNGKLTLFPNWLEHYTDEVNDDLRITIAFDIINEESYKKDIFDNMKNHWEKI